MGLRSMPLRERRRAWWSRSTFFRSPDALNSSATTPPTGSSELRTLCYNSGPSGDHDPPEILADLRAPRGAGGAVRHIGDSATLATGAPLPRGPYSAPIPPPAAYRIVRFTEDSNGFYINGQAFNEASGPMFTVHTGNGRELDGTQSHGRGARLSHASSALLRPIDRR